MPPSKPRVPSVLNVDGHSIRLTNLEKVLFPEDGYTKADLIRYYTEVSPYLIPAIKDRPLTLKVMPDGIAGQFFYQKDKPQFTPKWVKTWVDNTADREGGIDYVLGNDLATLIWLANYTAIEIHPWLSRVDEPDHPDIAHRPRSADRRHLGRRERGRPHRARASRRDGPSGIPEDDRLARDPHLGADRSEVHV